MKTKTKNHSLFVVLFGLALATVAADVASSGELGDVRAHGSQTNGIAAWVRLDTAQNPFVSVHVEVAPDAPLSLQPLVETNGVGTAKTNQKEWTLYLPPDISFGKVQLLDATKAAVNLTAKGARASEKYVSSFSIAETRLADLRRRAKSLEHGGPAVPIPVRARQFLIGSFYLNDYFDLKTPGLYELTVWPILYTRSPTNRDVCNRLDLPPVTVNVGWQTK